MALYNVKFELLSPISTIPNSQTIFGTICTYYACMYGDKDLENILKDVNTTNYPFIVSSMFFKDTIPLPLTFNPEYQELTEKRTKLLKSTKKIKYLSKDIFLKCEKNIEKLNSVILDFLENEIFIIKNDILMTKEDSCNHDFIMVKNERTRVYIEDKQYYNNYLTYFSKGMIFDFYMDIPDITMYGKIEKLLKKMNYITFGGGKSVGYNMFSFKSIKLEKDLKSPSPNLLLSLAIGDKTINYDESFYKINIINNKFNVPGEAVNRKKIVCFSEGSCIKTSSKVIGGLVKEENNGNITYQNFLGLLI